MWTQALRPRNIPIATAIVAFGFSVLQAGAGAQSSVAKDPGPRSGTGAGAPLAGITSAESEYFFSAKEEFSADEDVSDGLGPRMNLDSCSGCHLHPAIGGSSPSVNPQ